ncbi:MAG: allophanate hydrolase [Alphaproteobacteria bacterium]|nr:allophanate hydrolase [Alphaproteobacteria bacterium]
MLETLPFTLSALRDAYATGTTPEEVVAECYRRIDAVNDPALFIHLRDQDDVLIDARTLGVPADNKPLWGIPYVIKDNIDVKGLPTTAACPAFTRVAPADAFVVARLRAAGALLVGKTNLDQFATGLVGTRSPYGIPRNAVDPKLVPGGSSSGSAVAVAQGIVAFSLGTDTAGSGRVPAALNNIVGLKPTIGLLSASGMVPACRTLDTISIFAQTVGDAYEILRHTAAYDPDDAYSRKGPVANLSHASSNLKIGIPDSKSIQFFGDQIQAASFQNAVDHLSAQGVTIVPLDFTDLYDIAEMLYEGAWVAERYSVIEPYLAQSPDAVLPVTRSIVAKAEELNAVDAFRGFYRLQDLRRKAETVLSGIDLLCVPTIPTFYTLEDLAADPVGPNSRLGTYTNFVNLIDMCGIAVPTTARSDGRPGSVTLLAPAFQDGLAASVARLFEATDLEAQPSHAGVEGIVQHGEFALAVCGAHMSGLPLNWQLTSLKGRFLRKAKTAASYDFYALAGGPPERPGLVRCANGSGSEIEIEIWALPIEKVGQFLINIPAPLAIGTVILSTGETVHGFVCEAIGAQNATNISDHGSWRHYLETA